MVCRSLHRTTAAPCLAILLLPALAAAQGGTAVFLGDSTPSNTPGAVGTSTVRGRVLAAESGRPVRGARVQIAGGPLPMARVTMVDTSGAYEFKDLPAGRFTVSASAPAFIGLSYGQTRPFEAGKPIVVADKQQVDTIDVRLPRGGAITGVISDERNQPLISAIVIALRSQYVRGVRQLVQVGRALTNDVGEYRMYGLAPGSYLVSASKGFSLSPSIKTTSGSGFPPTFFPGTLSEGSAARVELALSQTRAGVSFSLDPSPAGAIGGESFFMNGQPALFPITPSIRLVNRSDSALQLPRTSFSGDGIRGTFLATGLSPGEYDIRIVAPAANGMPPQGAATRVILNGDNVTDLTLQMQPLPPVSGKVVVEPGITGTVPLAGMRLTLESVDPADPRRFLPPTPPGADGTFTLYGPSGPARLRPVMPNGWGLKAVRIKGDDVTDTGFEFRDGQAIVDLEVEVTNRLTSVTGSARDGQGQPALDYAVIVFSQERMRWTGDARYFATVRPDQAGRFAVSGLAPGEYYAAALDYLDPAEAQNPGLLERLQRDASPFVLRDGESRPLDLKVLQP